MKKLINVCNRERAWLKCGEEFQPCFNRISTEPGYFWRSRHSKKARFLLNKGHLRIWSRWDHLLTLQQRVSWANSSYVLLADMDSKFTETFGLQTSLICLLGTWMPPFPFIDMGSDFVAYVAFVLFVHRLILWGPLPAKPSCLGTDLIWIAILLRAYHLFWSGHQIQFNCGSAVCAAFIIYYLLFEHQIRLESSSTACVVSTPFLPALCICTPPLIPHQVPDIATHICRDLYLFSGHD